MLSSMKEEGEVRGERINILALIYYMMRGDSADRLTKEISEKLESLKNERAVNLHSVAKTMLEKIK